MKKLLRTTISLALCAVLLLCAAAPAFAATDNHSHIEYGYGVNVECNSVLNAIRAKGTITLSFVPNVNHMLEGSYSCGVEVYVKYTGGGHASYYPGLVSGMTTWTSISHGSSIPDYSEYTYNVNSSTGVYWTRLYYNQ